MTKNILVEDEKYRGRHVAIIDSECPEVVGDGDTPEEALAKAKQNGYEDPLLLYVPEEDSVHIYQVSL